MASIREVYEIGMKIKTIKDNMIEISSIVEDKELKQMQNQVHDYYGYNLFIRGLLSGNSEKIEVATRRLTEWDSPTAQEILQKSNSEHELVKIAQEHLRKATLLMVDFDYMSGAFDSN